MRCRTHAQGARHERHPHQEAEIGPGAGQSRGMGEAHRPRRRLPPRPPLRHGRDDREPHLDPRAGRGRRLSHQSLRDALRSDARLVLHQARPRRQDPLQSHRVRRQQGGIHHPQRHSPRAARGGLRDPHAYDRRDGGVGDEGRADALRPDGDALHRHRLPRLRGRRDQHGRAGAPGARPGEPRGDDPQEPRPLGRRREHPAGVRQHLPPGARLPAPGDDARLQHRDLAPAAQDHRGRIASVSARGAPQARAARMAGADQEARRHRPVLPRVAAQPEEAVMTGLSALWLPILLSSVIVFVASTVIHMALPWCHKSDYPKVPNEDRLRDALRPLAVPPGDYMVPRPANMKEMRTPELSEKMKKGPVMVLTVIPDGPPSMTKSLVLWFIYSAVVALLAAYVAARDLPAGAPYLRVFQLVGATAFIGYTAALFYESFCYHRAWGTTIRSTVDGLAYALLTAGTFGWLWPR